MKTHQLFPLVIASIAIASSQAQSGPSNTLQHNVVFQLSLKYEGGSVHVKNRNGFREVSRFVTERISNKQILEELKEAGVINTIRGWSIVIMTDHSNVNGFYLTKKDELPIPLGCKFKFRTSCEDFEEYDVRVDERKNPPMSERSTRSGIGQFTMRVGNFGTRDSQGDYSIRMSAQGYGDLSETTSEEIGIQEISYYNATVTGISFNNLTSIAYQSYDVTALPEGDSIEIIDDYNGYDSSFGIMTGGFNAGKGKPIEYLNNR